MVDIESDGPCPGLFSMISLGAVIVRPGLKDTFFAQFRPISDEYQQEALNVNKITREESLTYPEPCEGMKNFKVWIEEHSKGRPRFISDNNGFDWQFVNYYFHKFVGSNPFGHSSTNLGSLYKGYKHNVFKNFKHLRITKHSHDPVDDAMGNAEALLTMKKHGLNIPLE